MSSQDEIKVEVKVDDSIAEGKYSNFANIANSMDEFIFDFLFLNPTPPPGFGKLVSRMILTPGHAKRFMLALTNNIRDYEMRFGEIKVEPGFPDKPIIQ